MSVPSVETAAAGSPRTGEVESGDAFLVVPSAGGALVAVVDGLGHGREAADAARLALLVVVEHAGDRLLVATDGARVQPSDVRLPRFEPLQRTAARLLAARDRRDDDALVVVVSVTEAAVDAWRIS